jgi:uncharacterized low-complexity protein
MSKQTNKPIALAVGAALVGGLALSASAFAMTDLSTGYMVASATAGEPKAGEGKCGEGKCGMEAMDTDKDGKVSSAEFAAAHKGDSSKFAAHDTDKDGFISAEEMKMHKGAEGKCGGEKKATDKKADMEGKCGEGKCGGMA